MCMFAWYRQYELRKEKQRMQVTLRRKSRAKYDIESMTGACRLFTGNPEIRNLFKFILKQYLDYYHYILRYHTHITTAKITVRIFPQHSYELLCLSTFSYSDHVIRILILD